MEKRIRQVENPGSSILQKIDSSVHKGLATSGLISVAGIIEPTSNMPCALSIGTVSSEVTCENSQLPLQNHRKEN